MPVEFLLRGWLDAHQVAQLRRDILARVTPMCEQVLITGHDLRYRDVAGLAAFAALLDEMAAQFPQTALLLNHFSPELIAAASLAGFEQRWHFVTDQTDEAATPAITLAPLPPRRPMRSTGVHALDSALHGGYEPGSTWLIEGVAGAGKSLLGMHFLAEGIAHDEPGLLITAAETPAKLMQFIGRNWPQLATAVAQHRLAVLDPAPFFTEIRLAKQRKSKGASGAWDDVWRFVQDVVKQSRNQGAQRIVIDPLTPLLLGYDNPIDLWDSVQTLVTGLEENLGATTLLTHITAPDPAFAAIGTMLQTLCSGVLDLKRAPGNEENLLNLHIAKNRHHPLTTREVVSAFGNGGQLNPQHRQAA